MARGRPLREHPVGKFRGVLIRTIGHLITANSQQGRTSLHFLRLKRTDSPCHLVSTSAVTRETRSESDPYDY